MKKEKIKKVNTYSVLKIKDYLAQKFYFVGLKNGKKHTNKYSNLISLLNANSIYKRKFNNGTLKVITVNAVKSSKKGV